MLEEMLTKVESMARAGLSPSVLSLDKNDSRTAYLWNPRSEKLDKVELRRPDRRHTVTTLTSLAGAFARYTVAAVPSVWVSLSSVCVVMDDDSGDSRTDRISLPVTPSPLFDKLGSIPTQQKPLLNAIRHDLKPSKIAPESFELSIAALIWETTDTTEGNYGTVKSTMGRKVNSEVKSGGDTPPEVTVSFEAFPALSDDFDCIVDVECSVIVDPSEKTITVRPYPGQLDMAKAIAVEALRTHVAESLKATETTVFAGMP